jgi:UDPglucose 6-dehydrogenase
MKVAILGAGYVGLVTGAGLAQAGHHVTCYDIDQARLEPVKKGRTPFFEPGLDDLLKSVVNSRHLLVAASLSEAMHGADISIIAVGTPSTQNGIDLSDIKNTAESIGHELPKLGRYHVVVVKSTVVPGTTDTLVKQTLEETSRLTCGKDFGIGMIPEFLREGNAVEDCLNPDRIVIGAFDEPSGKVLTQLFERASCPIIKTNLRNAEMVKYASNALLATLISFSNEISGLCESVPNLSEEEVMAALHLDRRLAKAGILPYLRGGIGFGGSCFPKDVKALREFAVHHNAPHAMLDAVLATNEGRADAVINLLDKTIGGVHSKRIAVAGLAFKENTDDTRESPATRIINTLCRHGAHVVAHDPAVDGKTIKFEKPVEIALTIEDALRGADACITATRWPQYFELDWQKLLKLMRRPVILDGRQVVSPAQRIAPMIYVPIGSAPKGRN